MDFVNALVMLSNFVIVPALSYGSQLALGAIGVTLIYGILRFANFAYGDLMAFGTMFAILFTWFFQSIGISLGVLPTALLAIPFAIIIAILFSLLIDKFVFSYYRIKKSPPRYSCNGEHWSDVCNKCNYQNYHRTFRSKIF